MARNGPYEVVKQLHDENWTTADPINDTERTRASIAIVKTIRTLKGPFELDWWLPNREDSTYFETTAFKQMPKQKWWGISAPRTTDQRSKGHGDPDAYSQ